MSKKKKKERKINKIKKGVLTSKTMNGAITGRLIIVNPRTQAHRLLFARNFAHTFLLGQGIALKYNFSHQPHGGAITGRLLFLPTTAPISVRLCMHTP